MALLEGSCSSNGKKRTCHASTLEWSASTHNIFLLDHVFLFCKLF